MTTDKMSAHVERMMHAIAAIKRLKPPRGIPGVIPCPNCGATLHYCASPKNGHVRAYCDTKGCVSFIE